MKKQTIIISIVVIFAIIAIAAFVVLPQAKQTFSQTSHYETAFFGYLSCDACGEARTAKFTMNGEKDIVVTEAVGDTSQWTLSASFPATAYGITGNTKLSLTLNGQVVSEDRINIGSRTLTVTGTFAPKDVVKLSLQTMPLFSWQTLNKPVNYTIVATPYCLYRYNALGGGATQLNTRDCTITNEAYSGEVLSETVVSNLGFQYVNGYAIRPGEHLPIGVKYNYIADFVTVPAETLQTYNNQPVKCLISGSQHILYGFSTITTPAGTYNFLDMGKQVATVDCCERESTLTKTCQNGKWILQSEAQCNLLKPCAGSTWNINSLDPTTIIKYNCVNDKCIAETKKVACTSNQMCDAGQVCIQYNCVNSGTGTPINTYNQSQNAGCSNMLFGIIPAQFVNSYEQSCNLWCKIGITQPTTTTTPKCIYDYTFIIIISAIIVILLGIWILKPANNNKIKSVYRRRK